MKDAKTKSVVFRSSENFSSADPDFEWMRETVQKALDPPKRKKNADRPDNPSEDAKDVCAYNPTDEVAAGD